MIDKMREVAMKERDQHEGIVEEKNREINELIENKNKEVSNVIQVGRNTPLQVRSC